MSRWPVERLLRKQRLVHPVDQMHAGIRQTLALLGDIEIPGGTRVRQAGETLGPPATCYFRSTVSIQFDCVAIG
jgi:hypothetical protein